MRSRMQAGKRAPGFLKAKAPLKAGARRMLLLSALLCLGVLGWGDDGLAQETGNGLRQALEALADEHDFTISGIDELEDSAAASDEGGSLAQRLNSLLLGYNFLLEHDASGAIARLRIFGPHPSAEEVAQRIAVRTTRRGDHHVVAATLVGPRGARRTLPLMVDTGASLVVLPSSMMKELGFKSRQLRVGESQTAAGPVEVKLGKLESVQVGHAFLRNVAVGFIEDDKLGEQNLLGMSFLGRFRLTIDDESDRIILLPR